MDGKNPAFAVSAGNAIIPAPTAVPANSNDAPAMLPSRSLLFFPFVSLASDVVYRRTEILEDVSGELKRKARQDIDATIESSRQMEPFILSSM